VNTIAYSSVFTAWLDSLRDQRGRALILGRLQSALLGNFGDHKSVGDGLYEFRIHFGPGYRVYFMRVEERLYFLLVGGTKATQRRDIKVSMKLMKRIRTERQHAQNEVFAISNRGPSR
jgi:putative addiction module killer protein